MGCDTPGLLTEREFITPACHHQRATQRYKLSLLYPLSPSLHTPTSPVLTPRQPGNPPAAHLQAAASAIH